MEMKIVFKFVVGLHVKELWKAVHFLKFPGNYLL